MNGIIFDIQRFSVHDGPGIRTTVFLKGCPLRCAWCHNPEGLSANLQLQYIKEECIGCKLCGNRNFEDTKNCPTSAFRICGKIISTADLLNEVLKDKAFYDEDGGVTFSGGECLIQDDFVATMLELLKSEKINTAIDTSGYVEWKNIEKTLPYCDLYLYDIKAFDTIIHKKHTGVNNSLILENLSKLNSLNKRIWVRIPLIPSVNNDVKEITKIAEFLSSLKSVEQVTLMPYHPLGKNKYESLSLHCNYETDERISTEELTVFIKIFESHGIKVV